MKFFNKLSSLGKTYSKATILYNKDHNVKDDKTWTEGPSMTEERSRHSCALFKSPQYGHTDTVIVAGGSRGRSLYSTEVLNLDSSNSWKSGK
jgi:hypothetical protein